VAQLREELHFADLYLQDHSLGSYNIPLDVTTPVNHIELDIIFKADFHPVILKWVKRTDLSFRPIFIILKSTFINRYRITDNHS